jgi:hypothetical protein
MKAILINRISILFILILGWMTVKGQQQWEVPGDNFSLEGALEIFKKSASPEEFERMLNDPEARVNNLDLNGDGYIDYIRVIDMYEGNVHAFVLQAVISERESQDIAVITLEKLSNGRAILQITGDADIYGVETIIEPTTEVRTYAGYQTSRVIVNVWAWPMVRYVYGPYYRVWVSPWGWGYSPYWWRPWRPFVYYDYYSYWRPYWGYYSVCYTHRVYYGHSIYWPHRTTSLIVHNIHHHRITAYRSTHVDREGYYQPREGRTSSRQTNNVRYNSDGRIISNANVTPSSRYSARNSMDQSRLTAGRESENTVQRSSANSRRYSGNDNARLSGERSSTDAYLRRSGTNSTGQSTTERSNGGANMRSSSGNSGIQGSDVRAGNGANYRQANSGNSVQRSSGGTSANSSLRGSDVRSNNGGNYRMGNSSPNVQRSSGRSNGSPDIQRAPQRSGSQSNFRNSSGSSSSPKSYNRTQGNSNVRPSTGNRSSIQRSSGGSSGSSNSQRSGSSNPSNSRRR